MKNQQAQSQKAHMERQNEEIKERLHHIRNKILVMSGKGGVGKSSVAAHLAVVLAERGYRVGLMDVDLHGPSIPRMLGLKGALREGGHEGKMRPVQYVPNLEVMSIETLMGDKDAATIWRGPLKGGVIRQFISDIEWMDLDYMVIDSPPGTGDEPLTVAQTISDAKALIVTTPQEVSLADVRKSINFCRQVHMEILGLVENMSGLQCPHCGKRIDLFKTRGGEHTADVEKLRFLGALPIEPMVVQSGDTGSIGVLRERETAFSRAFDQIVDVIVTATLSNASSPSESKVGIQEPGKPPEGTRVLTIPVSNGLLSAHFGHSEQFAFVDTRDGKILETRMLVPPTHEPGVLPQWLHEQGANVAIVGGMGEQAQGLLRQNGIEVILGAPMDSPESLANQYLSNSLVTGSNSCTH